MYAAMKEFGFPGKLDMLYKNPIVFLHDTEKRKF